MSRKKLIVMLVCLSLVVCTTIFVAPTSNALAASRTNTATTAALKASSCPPSIAIRGTGYLYKGYWVQQAQGMLIEIYYDSLDPRSFPDSPHDFDPYHFQV